MTKRRPTIRGRGAEILFGEPPPLPTPALETDAAPGEEQPLPADELEAAEPEGAAMDAGAEPLAEAEADAGGPAMAGDDEQSPPGDEPEGADMAAGEEPPPAGFEPGPHAPAEVAEPAILAEPELPRELALPDAENLPELEPVPADALRDLHAAEEPLPAPSPPESPPPPEVEGLVQPRPAVWGAVPATATTLDAVPAPRDGDMPASYEPQSEPQPEPEIAVPELDLEPALYEEARDAEPDAEAGEPLPAPDEVPPTPVMEAAFIEEATAAQEPPEPVADVPIPTLEATMDEQTLTAEAALDQPPPPETAGGPARGVLPPRPTWMTFEGFDQPGAELRSADVQGSGAPSEPLPVRNMTEEEQKRYLERVGAARLAKLEREIDRTYQRVLDVVGDNEELSNEAYRSLLEARNIVWSADAKRLADAEFYIEQVQSRLKRAEDSMVAAKRFQWRILAWGGGWGLIFLTLLILFGQAWFRNAVMPPPGTDAQIDMRILVPAMVWGGIGGVTAVLYSLFKHVGLRDFDPAYNLSYIGKPFLGVILGVAVYMVFYLVMRALYIFPTGMSTAAGDTPEMAPGVVYLFAWAGGFKENRVLDLVDRVMKQIFSGSESTPPAPPGPDQPGAPGS